VLALVVQDHPNRAGTDLGGIRGNSLRHGSILSRVGASGKPGAVQGISGYEPLRNDRRSRLEALRTGDGRPLPPYLKAQISRELDRLELLLEQLKAVEAERNALLEPANDAAPVAVQALAGL